MHGFVFYRGHIFLSTHGDVPAVLKEETTSRFYCCYWVLHCYGMLPTFSTPIPCLNACICLFFNSGKVQWVSLRTEGEYITVMKNNISMRYESPLPFNKSFHYGRTLQVTVKRSWAYPAALEISEASIQFLGSYPLPENPYGQFSLLSRD